MCWIFAAIWLGEEDILWETRARKLNRGVGSISNSNGSTLVFAICFLSAVEKAVGRFFIWIMWNSKYDFVKKRFTLVFVVILLAHCHYWPCSFATCCIGFRLHLWRWDWLSCDTEIDVNGTKFKICNFLSHLEKQGWDICSICKRRECPYHSHHQK